MDLCEFQGNLGYKRSMQKEIQVVVAHTINLSTTESHTFHSSTRGEYMMGGNKGSGLSLQSPSLDSGKMSLVV